MTEDERRKLSLVMVKQQSDSKVLPNKVDFYLSAPDCKGVWEMKSFSLGTPLEVKENK